MTYFQEDLKPIYDLDAKIRGTILTYTIYIETLVSRIISYHFCDDDEKADLLFSLVFCDKGVHLKTKEIIFNKLLEICYPKFLEKYPKLPDDIEAAIKLRNRFAHAILDTSNEFLDQF